jgi:hypothetical protein
MVDSQPVLRICNRCVNDLPPAEIHNEWYSFEVGVRAVVRVRASDRTRRASSSRPYSEHRAARKSNWQIETTKGWAGTPPAAVDFVQKTPASWSQTKEETYVGVTFLSTTPLWSWRAVHFCDAPACGLGYFGPRTSAALPAYLILGSPKNPAVSAEDMPRPTALAKNNSRRLTKALGNVSRSA